MTFEIGRRLHPLGARASFFLQLSLIQSRCPVYSHTLIPVKTRAGWGIYNTKACNNILVDMTEQPRC